LATVARNGLPWAGIASGPGAWATNTQTTYALVPWVCAHHFNVILPVAALLALVALCGAFLSWRAWQAHGGLERMVAGPDGRPRLFLAGTGMAAAVLFAIVIATQGAASFVLTGCER